MTPPTLNIFPSQPMHVELSTKLLYLQSIHLNVDSEMLLTCIISDPDMPAAPVSAAQVHEWLVQSIADALEHITERTSVKENGPSGAGSSDQDVAMTEHDANAALAKPSTSAKGLVFIECVSNSSFVKQAADIKGSSMKVVNCHDSVIYILAPLRYATIYGSSDATIILGAVGKVIHRRARNAIEKFM
ncbi:hypothetical protein Ancab_030960 [Ancistrocladus abbreviatus]